ncbi:hypothetical protein GCM10027296_22890 [Chitinimonas naiadis]
MKARDILREVSEKKLSESDAEQVLESLLDSPQAAEIETLLGFSRTEWTAYGQGALISELASWRKNGWPALCLVCGAKIDIGKFGWRVIEKEERTGLKHIRCP